MVIQPSLAFQSLTVISVGLSGLYHDKIAFVDSTQYDRVVCFMIAAFVFVFSFLPSSRLSVLYICSANWNQFLELLIFIIASDQSIHFSWLAPDAADILASFRLPPDGATRAEHGRDSRLTVEWQPITAFLLLLPIFWWLLSALSAVADIRLASTNTVSWHVSRMTIGKWFLGTACLSLENSAERRFAHLPFLIATWVLTFSFRKRLTFLYIPGAPKFCHCPFRGLLTSLAARQSYRALLVSHISALCSSKRYWKTMRSSCYV